MFLEERKRGKDSTSGTENSKTGTNQFTNEEGNCREAKLSHIGKGRPVEGKRPCFQTRRAKGVGEKNLGKGRQTRRKKTLGFVGGAEMQ